MARLRPIVALMASASLAGPALPQKAPPPPAAVSNLIKNLATVETSANDAAGPAIAAIGPNSPLQLASRIPRIVTPPVPYPGMPWSRADSAADQAEPVSTLRQPVLSAHARADLDIFGTAPFATFLGRSFYRYDLPQQPDPRARRLVLWVHLLVHGSTVPTRGMLPDGTLMRVDFGNSHWVRVRAVDGPVGQGTRYKVEGFFGFTRGSTGLVDLGTLDGVNHFFVYQYPARIQPYPSPNVISSGSNSITVEQAGRIDNPRPSPTSTVKKNFYIHSWLMFDNLEPVSGPVISFYPAP